MRPRQALSGRVLKTVGCRLRRAEDLQGTLVSLKEMYGKPEYLIDTLLAEIRFRAPPLKEDRLDSLLDFTIPVEEIREKQRNRTSLRRTCGERRKVQRNFPSRWRTQQVAEMEREPAVVPANWTDPPTPTEASNNGTDCKGLHNETSMANTRPRARHTHHQTTVLNKVSILIPPLLKRHAEWDGWKQ
ncbi:hypothetical protein ZHAS_00009659 [Anopheles sinensis]|uniref:Uncharacterized protein n=1 Tax=Anopheles sinensis TaxID=74873 RepID=A0A084VV26_ANOSI|nr:hypothetical protein ZHAS_00009659 [Anopheles sinensis]